MDDIIQEFIAETVESLDQLDLDLVELERNPGDESLIANIFRVLHTIKGTSGFLGLERLGQVAHKGEDVLGLMRDGKLAATPDYITLILECMDTIKAIIAGIEATGSEPEGDDMVLIIKLEAVYNSDPIPTSDPEPRAADGATQEQAEPRAPAPAPQEEAAPPAPPPPPAAQAPDAPPAQQQKAPAAQQSLRVNVQVLEDLMTMVSELVLTRNQLMQIARQNGDRESVFAAPLQNLNHVVSDLQEGVMKTRMQPIGNAWSKLPRIIRDVAADLGKKIDLQMSGQETELDRQILEMIKDPLTHMVRNSADHGIETPDARAAAGKPETGTVNLKAFHQGGHIIVEIADDGKGLPMGRIKDKIVTQGLATAQELAAMPTHKIQQYIFHAGLSTAEKVTSVSGRGVGMDVVRSNIEKIGGSIEMRSEEGKGTVFTIKIPLTLAIVSALIVGVGGQRFAIPQLSVSELVLVGGESAHPIEEIGGAQVLRLRDRLLPLVSLSDMLGLAKPPAPEGGAPGGEGPAETKDTEHNYVIVTRVGSTSFGLIVDEVYDLEEIVIKPLSQSMKDLPVFAGNTILGDGCVIMILDPAGILKTVGVAEVMDAVDEEDAESAAAKGPETLLLLFRGGDATLKAAPVDSVARLEEIKTTDIAQAAGQPVIPYLGKLLPIQDLGGYVAPANEDGPEERRPLIILRHEGRMSGLLADQIMDVAAYDGTLESEGAGPILTSVILDETPADIVNAASLAAQGIAVDAQTQEAAAHG